MLSLRYGTAAIALGLVWGLTVGSDAQDWQTVRIEADEYRFVPNRIQIRSEQPAKIEIKNVGNEQHEFRSKLLEESPVEVEGGGLVVKGAGIHSILIEKGATAMIKWTSPAPGLYDFECRIPSHHGMDGTIQMEAKE